MNDVISGSVTDAVSGGPRTVLRLEGLVLFAAMTVLYASWGGSWWPCSWCPT